MSTYLVGSVRPDYSADVSAFNSWAGCALGGADAGRYAATRHIFRRMILADAATIVITGHIERPMERMLTMPVLADHNHKGRSGPYQA